MILLKFAKNRDEWASIYNRCYENFLRISFKSLNKVALTEIKDDLVFKELTEKIYDFQSLSGYYEKELKTRDYKNLKKILDKYSSKKDFLSNLARITVFTLVKNFGAASNLIKELINRDFRFFSLEDSWWNDLTHEDRQNILDLIYSALKQIADSGLPTLHKNVLFQFLNALDPGDRIKSIINSKGIDISLAEIRKLSDSRYWGSENTMAWFVIFSQRTFESEAISYLLKNSVHFSREKQLKDLWAYSFYLPTDEAFRKNLLNTIRIKFESEEIEEQFINMMFLEHETVRKDLSEMTPPFQIRRRLYTKLYDKNIATDLAIYNLYLLNDKDQNLWTKLYHVKN